MIAERGLGRKAHVIVKNDNAVKSKEIFGQIRASKYPEFRIIFKNNLKNVKLNLLQDI